MPKCDGTGPAGLGPGIGRKRGFCHLKNTKTIDKVSIGSEILSLIGSVSLLMLGSFANGVLKTLLKNKKENPLLENKHTSEYNKIIDVEVIKEK